MFRFLGSLLDCALGKNQKIINNQSEKITQLKAGLGQQNEKVKQLEAEAVVLRDLSHKSTLEVARKDDEIKEVRQSVQRLAEMEEKLVLANADWEVEVGKKQAERLEKRKPKNPLDQVKKKSAERQLKLSASQSTD